MARAHEVAIGADGRDFSRAVKSDIIKPVEDAARALDELAEAGEDAGQDGARDIGKLEDALRDAQRASERTADSVDDIRDSTRRAETGMRDMKDEANSTAREAAASFQEPADALDALQEVAANAFTGFGPAGAAAGLVAAVGLGAVTAEIGRQQEAALKLKEYFAEAYQSAAEEGRTFLDAAQVQSEALDIIFNPDRQGEYNRALDQSKQIGVDINTLVLARAGDQESLNVVLAATAAAEEEVKRKAEEAGSTAIRMSVEERHELDQTRREYEGIATLHDENAKRASDAQAIRDTLHAQERAQIDRTAQVAGERYEGLAAKYGQPIKARVEVDDSAVRNYRPPVIQIQGRIQLPAGSRQLIQ